MAENRLGSLAKQTAIYGLSSIVGRFLNYLLVPIHTHRMAAESGGYGIVTNLYAYTALLLVILTFGMETTFFRFSNKENVNPNKAFSTAGLSVGLVSLVFLILVSVFLKPIAGALDYALHPEFVEIMAIIVAFDAFQSILFARLRYENRPIKFMTLKLSFIIMSLLLNLFIFYLAPYLKAHFPDMMGWYQTSYQVGYIFIANLICTTLVFFGFIPEIKKLRTGIDRDLLKEMLKYTWPILLLGLAGILNQVADKIVFKKIVPGLEGEEQLGIYGACVKIAMIMAMITQAFILHYLHLAGIPCRGDVYACFEISCRRRLPRGFACGAYRDDGRNLHGHLFQSFVLVQAYRRDLVGCHILCYRMCGVAGHQLHLCAQIWLHGLRLGRLCGLCHLHGVILLRRPKESTDTIRLEVGIPLFCYCLSFVFRAKVHPHRKHRMDLGGEHRPAVGLRCLHLLDGEGLGEGRLGLD